MGTTEIAAREAKHGERMIEVRVRFWTDQIAEGKGNILPKHAHASGVVRMASNAAHGVKGSSPLPFNSLMELPGQIEKLLIQEGITLQPSSKMRRYFLTPK